MKRRGMRGVRQRIVRDVSRIFGVTQKKLSHLVSTKQARKKTLYLSVTSLTVFALISAVLLPVVQVRAEQTLTWSTNGDFSFNKIAGCDATDLTNVAVSGTQYTDSSCAASDTEASLSLAQGGPTYLTDVAQVSTGGTHGIAVKHDGTVWAWGQNNYGQLGDNSYTSVTAPVQVKDSTGTGYLTDVTAVATGIYSSYALRSDGTVWAWGYNSSGKLGTNDTTTSPLPRQVVGSGGSGTLQNVIKIAAADYHVLALKNDGTVWAWGLNTHGRLGDNTTTARYSPVQVKDTAGTALLYGISDIAVSSFSSYALRSDGTVWAWGSNGSGQLGDNTTTNRSTPVQVKGVGGVGTLTGVVKISAGWSDQFVASTSSGHVLALKSDGTVWAWGANASGQLGINSTGTTYTPTQVIGQGGTGLLSGIATVYAGAKVSYALANDGSLSSWGMNANGQKGNGNTTGYVAAGDLYPNPVLTETGSEPLQGVLSIGTVNTANSVRNTIAVTTGGILLGWGSNASSTVLGIKSAGSSAVNLPQPIASSLSTERFDNASAVAMGETHGVVVTDDSHVWAWGYNYSGQLGDNTTTSRSSPIEVLDGSGTGALTGVTDVSVGTNHTLALKQDGTVWAWGNNSYSQLGDGTTTQRTVPTQVKDGSGAGFLTDVIAISANQNFSLAVTSDGSVWAWGDNSYRQLGDGTTTTRSLPVRVKDSTGTGYLSGITDISAGGWHENEDYEYFYSYSVALASDGTVWAWGLNSNGQLGDGTTTTRSLPVQVKNVGGTGTLTNVAAISAGGSHTLAVKNDGTVWAWGLNSTGQLGDNTTTYKSSPIQVKDATGLTYLSGISKVATANNTSYAISNSGNLLNWGENSSNQLAENTNTSYKALPVQAQLTDGTAINGVAAVSGYQSVLALKSSGSMLSWGGWSYILLSQSGTSNNPDYVIRSVNYINLYQTSGTVSGVIVDAGAGKQRDWSSIAWNTADLPNGTTVSFRARTSGDATTWSAWTTPATQTTAGSTTGYADITSLPFSRYIEIELTLTSSTGDYTPKVTDFTLSYIHDTTAPPTNASDTLVYKSNGGASVADGDWTNTSPYISWTAGEDTTDASGTGIRGYCLYIGQDESADVVTTKGLLGDSPLATDGACAYATAATELDTSISTVLASPLTSSTSPYYILIKALDNAGNVFTGSAEKASFRYDNTPPANPAFISAPAGFIANKNVTLTWPINGSDAANDATSGLVGLQYRIGPSGTWYGDAHTGAQDTSDVLANDGSYTLDPTTDYPLINEGNNTIYFRTIDAAGNASTAYTTAAVKINTSAPSSPQNLTATPSSNTQNSFSFSWQTPETFVGQAANLTYCYTVNTLPSAGTCSYTTSASLAADAYATQPGENTLYVVARDESNSINYATYSTVTFTANTSAPGVAAAMEIADISTKATSSWKLALSWGEPDETGTGVARYQIYRSTNGGAYSQIATTSGLSYVDSGLAQREYTYYVRACDSANNCGAASATIRETPTGRFVEPPSLVSSPSVQTATRQAQVYWVTDRESDSRIQFGTESGSYFSSEITVSDLSKLHTVSLENLEAGTTYFYKVKWTDEDGNTGVSDEYSFTTLPAPAVKDVQVIKTTLSSAVIRFTSTNAARVSLYYGKDENLGGVTSINTSTAESTYDIELTGLDDGSTYLYKITTTDSDGNEYDSRRTDTFSTPQRPLISNLRFQPIEGEPTSTQKVTWTTNVPTSSLLTYGVEGTNGSEVYEARLTTNHELTITNLIDDSSYFLLAQGRDIDGNFVASDRQTFRTALDTRPPLISNTRVETSVKGNGSEARGQIIVSWRTDEPATSQVAFASGGNGTTYTNKTVEDTRLTTEHVVIISDLSVSSIYNLQPISKDKGGNTTSDTNRSAIIGRASESVLDIILLSLYKVFGI